MLRLWSVLQGMVEYGAVVGRQGAGGGQPITAWVADNRMALLAAAAVLLLLGLATSARRR